MPRLERALLHSFADQGPNPTALGACPGAAFVCNGRAHRSAPGWWAVFSCDMVIRCEETRTAGGTRAEQAELRFVPSGTGVMDGKMWTWQMTALRTGGQARLFVQDAAPYPSPLTNLLAYHALVVSRDALCSRVAHLLGTAQAEKCSQPWLRQHPHDRSAVPMMKGPERRFRSLTPGARPCACPKPARPCVQIVRCKLRRRFRRPHLLRLRARHDLWRERVGADRRRQAAATRGAPSLARGDGAGGRRASRRQRRRRRRRRR